MAETPQPPPPHPPFTKQQKLPPPPPLQKQTGAADSSPSGCNTKTPPHPTPSHQAVHNKLFFQAVATCTAFPPAEHMGPINCRSLTTLSCSNSLNLPRLHPRLHLFLVPTCNARLSDRSGNTALPIPPPPEACSQGLKRRERRLFFLPLNHFSPQIRLTAAPPGGKRRPAWRLGSNHDLVQGQVFQHSTGAKSVGTLAPPRALIMATRVTQNEAEEKRTEATNLHDSGLRLCSSLGIYGL